MGLTCWQPAPPPRRHFLTAPDGTSLAWSRQLQRRDTEFTCQLTYVTLHTKLQPVSQPPLLNLKNRGECVLTVALFFFANILFCIAYMVRDMAWLRAITILAATRGAAPGEHLIHQGQKLRAF